MSLRLKQAVILLFATVFPFALGGAAVAFVVAPAYRRTVIESSRETAQRLSDQLAWSLARDAAQLQRLAALGSVRKAASARPRFTPPPSGSGLSGLNAAQAKAVADPLTHPAAAELRWWKEANPAVLDLVVTNMVGVATAATMQTDPVGYRSQPWWRQSFHEGKGRVVISGPVPLSGNRGMAVTVGVPIYAEGRPGSMVVGILRASVNLTAAFDGVKRIGHSSSGEMMLTDTLGRVLVSAPTEGAAALSPTVAKRLLSQPAGGVIALMAGRERLLGWSAVRLGEAVDLPGARAPRLFLIHATDPETRLGPLHQVQRWMLVIAIATIAVAVGLGYWLADRIIARPVRAIAAGMRELARGDFAEAGRIADELCRVEMGRPRGTEKSRLVSGPQSVARLTDQ